jgi:hypothetical protein
MFLRLLVCSLLSVSPALAQAKTPAPEKVVQAMGAELRSAKTIGEWIEKSSPKNKRFRKTHFSKFSKEKIPQVAVSGASLLVFENNKSKKPSVLRVSTKDEQLVFTWNGYDITKPKRMNLEKWFGKKFPRFSRTAQWVPTSPFLSSAHAQVPTTVDQIAQNAYVDPNATSYWTAMMASMSADEWENVKLYEKYGAEDGSTLINAGVFMRDQYRMTCSPEGRAGFDYPFDGDPAQPLRIAASYDSSQGLARVSIHRVHADPVLSMKMGEIGRIAYGVMGKDSSSPGANAGRTYLFNGHTRANSEHDSLRDGNLLTGLYNIVNTSDSMVLANPTADATNRMYDMTQGLVALADFARACCANADCRGQAQLPTSGTGVSQ